MSMERWIYAIIMREVHNGTGFQDYYFSSAPLSTLPADSPANTLFDSRIQRVPSWRATAFREPWALGLAEISVGTLALANADQALDGWRAYATEGRKVEVYFGPASRPRALWSDFAPLYQAEMGRVVLDGDTVSIPLNSGLEALDTPLLQDPDKPEAHGYVRLAKLQVEDEAKLIYRFTNGRLSWSSLTGMAARWPGAGIYDQGINYRGECDQ